MGGGNTARIIIVSAEYTDSVSAESFAPAAQNGGFLLLDVLWETEEGVTSANPLYFDAKGAEGRRAKCTCSPMDSWDPVKYCPAINPAASCLRHGARDCHRDSDRPSAASRSANPGRRVASIPANCPGALMGVRVFGVPPGTRWLGAGGQFQFASLNT